MAYSADGQHHHAAGEVQPGVERLGQDELGERERDEAERKTPAVCVDGDGGAERERVARRAAGARQVRGDHGLAVARRQRVGHAEDHGQAERDAMPAAVRSPSRLISDAKASSSRRASAAATLPSVWTPATARPPSPRRASTVAPRLVGRALEQVVPGTSAARRCGRRWPRWWPARRCRSPWPPRSRASRCGPWRSRSRRRWCSACRPEATPSARSARSRRVVMQAGLPGGEARSRRTPRPAGRRGRRPRSESRGAISATRRSRSAAASAASTCPLPSASRAGLEGRDLREVEHVGQRRGPGRRPRCASTG